MRLHPRDEIGRYGCGIRTLLFSTPAANSSSLSKAIFSQEVGHRIYVHECCLYLYSNPMFLSKKDPEGKNNLLTGLIGQSVKLIRTD